MGKVGLYGGGFRGSRASFTPYVSSLVYFLNCWPFVKALILMSLAEDDGSRAANSNINEKNVCPAAVRKGYAVAAASAAAQVFRASSSLFFSFHFPHFLRFIFF